MKRIEPLIMPAILRIVAFGRPKAPVSSRAVLPGSFGTPCSCSSRLGALVDARVN
jgi:hypothetical protein